MPTGYEVGMYRDIALARQRIDTISHTLSIIANELRVANALAIAQLSTAEQARAVDVLAKDSSMKALNDS